MSQLPMYHTENPAERPAIALHGFNRSNAGTSRQIDTGGLSYWILYMMTMADNARSNFLIGLTRRDFMSPIFVSHGS
ncbi:hypothetical protein SBOR_9344 [Sclerotinia borealis F-4128]|uniref:Uncharacterized protein n=1 Tax=Sclerotinia borealis (strain F-4128) TaxID=1432307 RepID=W9C6S4_SCLBF|nr:hypothetical protein SBOR_9344 [Sclerotinia borealis F-4128]